MASTSARRHDVCVGPTVGGAPRSQTPGTIRIAREHARRDASASVDRESPRPAKARAGDCAESEPAARFAHCAGAAGKRNPRCEAGRNPVHHYAGPGTAAGSVCGQNRTGHTLRGECERGCSLQVARPGERTSRARRFQGSEAAHPRIFCRRHGLPAGTRSVFRRLPPHLRISSAPDSRHSQEGAKAAAARSQFQAGTEHPCAKLSTCIAM